MDQAFEGRPKVLFMDDDPMRGEIFLNVHPDAVLVATAEECIARLAEPWDEVHLDHDLGGRFSSVTSGTTAAWPSSAGYATSLGPT